MDRQSGFSYFMIIAKFTLTGFIFKQELNNNEVWWNPETNKMFISQKYEQNITEKALSIIQDQAGLTIGEFLAL